MNCKWIAAATVVVALLAHAHLRAEPPASVAKPAAAKQFVTVEVTCVEIDLTKLRAVGFDWDAVTKKSTTDLPESKKLELAVANNCDSFVRALVRHDLASFLWRPQLMTLCGRPASVAIINRLDIVPEILESGRIRVDHRLELPQRKFKLDSAVELDPGQAVISSQVRGELQDADGKARETTTIVVVRADTKITDRIGSAGAGVAYSSTVPSTQLKTTPIDKELELPPTRR
jgi:hypothetical protein